MNLKGLRKWSLAVIGVCAVVGIAAMAAYHGMSDFQFKLAVSAVISLTGTAASIQGFLDYLEQKGPNP